MVSPGPPRVRASFQAAYKPAGMKTGISDGRRYYFTAPNAASSAAMRSFTFSVPMDRRMVLGLMP